MMAQSLNWVADTLGKDVGELVPDVDYQDAILSYDWRTHSSTGISRGYMDRYGRLYVMKVGDRIGEVTLVRIVRAGIWK